MFEEERGSMCSVSQMLTHDHVGEKSRETRRQRAGQKINRGYVFDLEKYTNQGTLEPTKTFQLLCSRMLELNLHIIHKII